MMLLVKNDAGDGILDALSSAENVLHKLGKVTGDVGNEEMSDGNFVGGHNNICNWCQCRCSY